MNELTKKNEIVKSMLDVAFYPDIQEEAIAERGYTKIPLAEIAALGGCFAELTSQCREITQTIDVKGLYQAVLPAGCHLAQAGDIGSIGTALDSGNHLVGQARFIEAGPITQTFKIPYDPVTLGMAAALMDIERQLGEIKEMQQDLIDYLKQKDKSELRGNLNALTDILNNYKYNWNNEKYKTNNHIQVQSIRIEGEKQLDFYREMIKKQFARLSPVHNNLDTEKLFKRTTDYFRDYQLALYLYSFAYFLEAMLLENFDSAYLDSIKSKINDYAIQYRELYVKSMVDIEKYANSSIEAHTIKGMGKLNKAAGEMIARIPVVGDANIDEALIGAGDWLSDFSRGNADKKVDDFQKLGQNGSESFVKSINTVESLYNDPLELAFDSDNLYIKAIEADLNSESDSDR